MDRGDEPSRAGLVERVARAIQASHHHPSDAAQPELMAKCWRDFPHEKLEHFRAARAAIMAMRVPTDAMIEAGEAVECEGSAGYRAMIDAALQEEPGDE